MYKYITVVASQDDYDGDGELNATDVCQFIDPEGVDEDQDGTDDACDGYIGDAPAAQNQDNIEVDVSEYHHVAQTLNSGQVSLENDETPYVTAGNQWAFTRSQQFAQKNTEAQTSKNDNSSASYLAKKRVSQSVNTLSAQFLLLLGFGTPFAITMLLRARKSA
ncbi:MAG: hypothetical protein U0520_05485 [Candidatus Saccharimonadales bacterium]